MPMEHFNDIYRGKRILVIGHNGFKGSWLSLWLHKLGAEVVGFSLEDYYNDYVYRKTNLSSLLFADEAGDINDHDRLREVFTRHQPTIVFHLAAQPLVRQSYEQPLETLRTNVMGTAHVLECIRNSPSVESAVIVTTDKCYKNKERKDGYTETDELAGYDPYSSSKACAELIVDAYRRSFFTHENKLVATVRAGNVVGGGDFATDRLIPDCINHLRNDEPIRIRNPHHGRPWQHVLEPLYGYLLVGQRLLDGHETYAGPWNFGPRTDMCIPVRQVVELVIKHFGRGEFVCEEGRDTTKHETCTLVLDSTKATRELGWHPVWDIDTTIRMTVEGYRRLEGHDAHGLCTSQIDEYTRQFEGRE